jgi:hypothetical protein
MLIPILALLVLENKMLVGWCRTLHQIDKSYVSFMRPEHHLNPEGSSLTRLRLFLPQVK